jgi:arylsulfatase A-like enzyme
MSDRADLFPLMMLALLASAAAAGPNLVNTSLAGVFTNLTRPHIVLVLVDELGTGDVPWTDSEIIAPTLRELGESGLRLGTSYAWHWCAPTRGALLSGRFPMHTGYNGGGMPGDGQGMPLEVPLLSNELKRSGYTCHMLGKWHLGFRTVENLPVSRGFNTYFGLLGGGADHYTKTEEACGGDGENCKCNNMSSTQLPFRVDFWDGLAPAHALWDNTTYDAFQYTARAVGLVEQHDPTAPFFLYWAPHKVHSPLQCPEEFTKQYPLDPGGVCQSTPETCGRENQKVHLPRRGYGPSCGCAHMCYCNRRIIRGMVSVVDAMLANLTAALKKKDMWKDTVLIFLGDNGAPNQNAGSNSVFKGEKFGHYEGGHRVPTFFGGPLVSRSPLGGVWHNGTTHLVDLHATILDMAGVVAADPHKSNGSWVPPVDGVSLLPILNGTLPPGTAIRPELWIADDVLRVGSWKLITGGGAQSTQNMLGIGGLPVRTPHDPHDLNTTCGYSRCLGNETGADAELCIGCKCPSYNLNDPSCHACLFDVDVDPGEQTNQAAAHPAVVASMHTRLQQYREAKPHIPPNPPSDAYGACQAMVNKYSGFYGPWAAPSPAPVNPCSTGTAGGYVCHAGSCATENGHGCVGLLPDATLHSCPRNGDYTCATAAASALCAAKAGCTGYALSELMWGTVKLYNAKAAVVANSGWTAWIK